MRSIALRIAACVAVVTAACASGGEQRGATTIPPRADPTGLPVPGDDRRDYTGDRTGPGEVLPDLHGRPNPDPARVDGVTGDATIAVAPRDGPRDYENLQWAVDNVVPGGTVELRPGAFFLGDGATEPKHTVAVRRGLTIRGVRSDRGWHTVVQGGGALDTFSSLGGWLESGPFRVVNRSGAHAVVFADLWIRHWTGEAIYVEASDGFVLTGSRLSDPVAPAHGGIRFVHAVFSSGEAAQGPFRVEDNVVELGRYRGRRAHDEQLLGVFYANHDTIRVVGNTVTTIDEAIEIIGNRAAPDGTPYDPRAARGAITVVGNRVDVTQTVDDTWPGRFALLVANNRRASSVRVRANAVAVRGRGWALGLSGERLRVAGNTIAFEEHHGEDPPGAVLVGFPEFPGFAMGAGLRDSRFTRNRFSGAVGASGLVFSAPGDDSHGNTFDLGSSFAGLGARTTIAVAAGVHGNVFRGDLGTVVDASPAGANTFERG